MLHKDMIFRGDHVGWPGAIIVQYPVNTRQARHWEDPPAQEQSFRLDPLRLSSQCVPPVCYVPSAVKKTSLGNPETLKCLKKRLITRNAFVKEAVMQAKVIHRTDRNHPEIRRTLERKIEHALEM
jgi:hypothetical protein